MRRGAGRCAWLGASLLLLGPAGAAAQAGLPPAEQYTLRVEYLWWAPTPQGDFQKGLGDREGTLLDIEEDLAVESGSGHTLRGAFRLGEAWKLRLGWMPLDFQGDTPAGRPFSYGTLFARFGDRVITSFKGHQFNTDIEWDFMRGEEGFLGGLVGVRYFDVDTLVLNVDTGSRVAETQKIPIPVLGLTGRAYLGRWFSLEGEFSGLTLGSRGHLWDWLVSLRLHPTDRLAVTGGYHSQSLEGQDDRDFLRLKLSTWTFGLEISI